MAAQDIEYVELYTSDMQSPVRPRLVRYFNWRRAVEVV
jgi:hypothetical protein